MKFALSLCFATFLSTHIFAQSTWHYLPDAPNGAGRIDDVFFLDSQLGWCAGANGEIHKTTDGGLSWEKVYDAPVYLRCIEFYNDSIGYAGTLNAQFLRTTDGGHTWADLAPSISPVPQSVCGVSVVDSLFAYAVGQYDTPAFFLKTTDGGITWTSHSMEFYAMGLVDVFFMSRDTGFVTGQGANGKAVILYTTDGGQTWAKKFESTLIGKYVWKIQQVTTDFWVSSIQTFNGGRYAKSYDGGQTWTQHTAPVPDMQGIGFATPLHGWVGGYGNGFYETLDGGDSWEAKDFGGNFNRFYFLDSTLAFASGWSVFKFSDTTSSSVGQPLHPVLADDGFTIGLSPNPVDNFLEVSFHLPMRDNLRMSLYAADGTFIRELYHERFLLPGEYRFRAECASLLPGAYFLWAQRNHGLYVRPFSKL